MPKTVAGKFQVERLQILDEKGVVDKKLEPSMSKERLFELYEVMRYARLADEKLLKLQRQGRVGTFAPSKGQEASALGPVFALTEKDWLAVSFRELGALLARGMPLWRYYIYYKGFEEGNVYPEAPRTLPLSVPVASQMLHAVGLAYAMRYKGEKNTAALAFVGDGGTSQGDFHEALNFASVWQVPVVFLVQNNGWAISVPRSKQAHAKTLAQRAVGYDMPGIQVDGNDVLGVYAATKEALERAKSGGGPTLIEAVTYRIGVHTTSDDPTKYRTDDEVSPWLEKDPIVRFEKYLKKKKVLNKRKLQEVEERVKGWVDDAVKTFEEKTDLPPDLPFDHVLGEAPEWLEDQRKSFLQTLREEA